MVTVPPKIKYENILKYYYLCATLQQKCITVCTMGEMCAMNLGQKTPNVHICSFDCFDISHLYGFIALQVDYFAVVVGSQHKQYVTINKLIIWHLRGSPWIEFSCSVFTQTNAHESRSIVCSFCFLSDHNQLNIPSSDVIASPHSLHLIFNIYVLRNSFAAMSCWPFTRYLIAIHKKREISTSILCAQFFFSLFVHGAWIERNSSID